MIYLSNVLGFICYWSHYLHWICATAVAMVTKVTKQSARDYQLSLIFCLKAKKVAGKFKKRTSYEFLKSYILSGLYQKSGPNS